ncbi:MAG: AmmeMemoRadiSam system protein B [bacterium]|nr:MAG: AmmeMemoRadiSam system protein B [bacterium]
MVKETGGPGAAGKEARMGTGCRVPVVVSLLGSLLVCAMCSLAGGEEFAPPLRMPVDTIGYAVTVRQIEAVVAFGDSAERKRFVKNENSFPVTAAREMIGAICPHDDYLYAGPVYLHAMRNIRAPLVVLFGVSHSARRRNVQGKLIFDRFRAWKGPYGDTPVSPLREAVIASLPRELVLVSDEIHGEEHSLEAFIPFLQFYERYHRERIFGGASKDAQPRIEILPILVSRLPGALFEAAVDTLAAVLLTQIDAQSLKLGRDVMVLISADCVHYGDEKWGGRNYAPFGVGEKGYERGVEQDLDIIRTSLTGVVGGDRIASFRTTVERDDFHWPYKVTWCGVYSIPFGLSVLSRMCELYGREPPEGFLLRYATSIDPGRLPLDWTGLGVTNINTLRHWVGYAAIGYW